MGKFNSLLKKIEVFEKIAVYDSTTFLKKISQRTPDPGAALESYGRITAQVRSIVEILKRQNIATPSAYLQNKISQLESLLATGINLETAKAVYNYLNKLEREMGPIPQYVSSVRQIDPLVMQMQQELHVVESVATNNAPPPPQPEKIFTPNDLPQAPNLVSKPKYPAIPKEVQSYLNGLGSPFKLKEDGQLGPETQKALEWFRDTYKIPRAIKNESLFAQITQEHSKANKTKGLPFPKELEDEMARRNQELAEKS